jgi:hypothetical protein
LIHGCPVQRIRSFTATREQLQITLTGLVPVTHVFPTVHIASFEDVGGRNKSGHGEFCCTGNLLHRRIAAAES